MKFSYLIKLACLALIVGAKIEAAEFVTITSPANNSQITNTQPTISGLTTPGLEVLVTLRNSSNVDIFTVSVPSNATTGAWSTSIAPLTLSNGNYTIIATTPGASDEIAFSVAAAVACSLPADILAVALRLKYIN